MFSRRPKSGERGQATVEYVALLLLVGLLLFAGTKVIKLDSLVDKIRCAIAGESCNSDLNDAYGYQLAMRVRAHVPRVVYEAGLGTLPVDFRECRKRHCSDVDDPRGRELTRTRTGLKPTVFTQVVDCRDHRPRRSKREAIRYKCGLGGVYIQYWFYYPDSRVFGVPAPVSDGYHRDDWEGYLVHVTTEGYALVQSTAHHGLNGRNRIADHVSELPLPNLTKSHAWTIPTGSTYVTMGSHAGKLVKGPTGDESWTDPGHISLIPIETLDEDVLATDFGEIVPPWEKRLRTDPEAKET